ncbi:MAG: hypothetical protein V4659_04945 [Pseudomonadota bacterium]
MSAVVSGLIGGAIAAALGAIALRTQGTPKVDHDGWKTLTPSWLLHMSVFLGAVMTAGVVYFFAIGGSSLPDANSQNVFAMGLGIAFAVMTAWCAWLTYLQKISWNSSSIRRSALGQTSVFDRQEFVRVRESSFLGTHRIIFRGGSSIRFFKYANGASDLVESLSGGIARK